MLETINELVATDPNEAGVHHELLGDPTLRLLVAAPPSGLIVTSAAGGTVSLAWQPSPEAGARYVVYRAAGGIDGAFTKLTPVPIADVVFHDASAPSGLKLYQVRTVVLQPSGSGSYTNLSQGIFVNVN